MRDLLLVAAMAGMMQAGIDDRFVPMFDGRTLAGWHWSRTSHHGTTAEATVENGALVLRQRPFGQGGLLLSDRSYTDFELSLEARPDPDFNSGIFLRSSEGGSAYQIELVRPGNTGAWLGEMMRLGQPQYRGERADINRVWKDGAWNTMRVRMVGEAPHVTLWINDVKMWELQMPANDQIGGRYGGSIGLQLHWTATYTNAAGVPYGSGPPWAVQRFRNIRVRELK